LIDVKNLSEDRIRPMAVYIIGQIDRMYYMSGQEEKIKTKQYEKESRKIGENN